MGLEHPILTSPPDLRSLIRGGGGEVRGDGGGGGGCDKRASNRYSQN